VRKFLNIIAHNVRAITEVCRGMRQVYNEMKLAESEPANLGEPSGEPVMRC